MRTRRPNTVLRYKIDHSLPPADLQEYRALIHDPATTNEAAHAWLTGRGVIVSQSAVTRHRRWHLKKTESRRQELDQVREIIRSASNGKSSDFAGAAAALLEYAAFQRVKELENEEGVSAAELKNLAIGMGKIVQTKQVLHEQKKRVEAETKPKQTNADIARRMNEILGLDRPEFRESANPGDDYSI